MKHFRVIVGVLGILILLAGLAACGRSEKKGPPGGRRGKGPGGGPPEKSIAVKVDTVMCEAISSTYSTSATLRADKRAEVIARTSGVIERLAVEEGDAVSENAPLAYLEKDEQAIAADRARTTAETRRREEERLEGLYEQNLISEDEYEKARREASDAAHAAELAELELSRTTIRAPFSGVVLRRHLDLGATVSFGTVVYELADLNPLYADIQVPERQVASIRVGQRVRLVADASKREVTARIERIAPVVEADTGTVKVTVAVEGSSDLRPGAFVRVHIVTDTHENALVVPRSALVAEGSRWFLYRLPKDAREVEQVQVEIGYESGERVEIARVIDGDKTLDVGDEVVIVGAPALSEGAKVRVIRNGESEAAEPESGMEKSGGNEKKRPGKGKGRKRPKP